MAEKVFIVLGRIAVGFQAGVRVSRTRKMHEKAKAWDCMCALRTLSNQALVSGTAGKRAQKKAQLLRLR
ncbi:MAG: hypothetical protein IT515_11325 [Burkholderiales bacterium]|nr:hypothetical protein [Burkholderiales bacterium]